jgi:hypothetical protein
MENEKSPHLYKIFASIMILVVLVFQASLIPARMLTGWSGEWYWPFIDYPMYDKAHYENEHPEIYFTLELTHKDGEIVKLNEDDLGMSFWNFFRLTNNMQKGEGKAVDLFMGIYPDAGEVAEIRLYSSPYVVTRQGRAESAPELLNRITF